MTPQQKLDSIRRYKKVAEKNKQKNKVDNLKDLVKIASSTQNSINLHLSTIKYSYKRIEELKEDLERLGAGY